MFDLRSSLKSPILADFLNLSPILALMGDHPPSGRRGLRTGRRRANLTGSEHHILPPGSNDHYRIEYDRGSKEQKGARYTRSRSSVLRV